MSLLIATMGLAPAVKELPDPFRFNDGSRVRKPEDWARRRDELKELFQQYEYGHMPPKLDELSAERTGPESLVINIRHAGKSIQMRVRLAMPANASKDHRVPVVIRPLFRRPPGTTTRATTAPSTDLFTSRGYALAQFEVPDVAPDLADRIKGVYELFGADIDCGVLMAWAWGFSRTIDALQTMDEIDASRIVATGHSRYGKAALIAGAFDDRIALTAPSHSGCAGTAPYRYLYGKCEAIENITGFAPYWFTPAIKQFVGKVEELPIDQHELRALVAPRAQLSTEGLADDWTNPQGSQLTYLAAKRVYEFLGAADQISIRFRPGGHVPNDEDLLDFADHIFFNKPLPEAFGRLEYPPDAVPTGTR